jgi:hypothetical protein
MPACAPISCGAAGRGPANLIRREFGTLEYEVELACAPGRRAAG